MFSIEPLLQIRNLAVLNLGGAPQIAGVPRLVQLRLQLFKFGLCLTNVLDDFFFGLPLRFHPGRFLFQVSDALLDFVEPLLRTLVFLALQSLPLDFQLHDLALKFIDFLWQRIDLNPQPGSCFVD